jgi:hypothetical protein
LQKFGNTDFIIRLLDYSVQKVAGGSVFYMLFPLYDAGTTWDAVEAAMASDQSPWPFPQVLYYASHDKMT